MTDRSIHKNLDTSFVNLSALIKYLRRRQFSGSVNVQLNGYRAEITLRGDNTFRVHEHDQISGRVSDGEEAFQRMLIRAREPGGTIDVFQSDAISNGAKSQNTSQAENGKSAAPITKATPVTEKVIPKPSGPLHVNAKKKPATNGHAKKANSPKIVKRPQTAKPKAEKPVAVKLAAKVPNTKTTLPDFPFILSNKVEAKAQQQLSSPEDWQSLLKLTVELLTVIDRSLAAANLNFSAEFQKICTEIADDYPFLNPDAEMFGYKNGKLRMRKQMSAKIFISGIAEASRKILLKLSKSGKYSEVYKLTSQRLQTLIKTRAEVYNRFAITTQIRRIISR